MSHDHDHDHDPRALRAEALESLLIERGLVTPEAIDAILRHYEEDVGPMNGARVVARAWTDADYRVRLLEDGTAAVAELGFGGPQGEHVVVVENSVDVHNVVVCTLCSCYPVTLLGPSPEWYKSKAYRGRVVRDPRSVLDEFGTSIDADREVRVHDSTADMRYMILPKRPAGTDDLSEAALADLVTRNGLIGVAEL